MLFSFPKLTSVLTVGFKAANLRALMTKGGISNMTEKDIYLHHYVVDYCQ